MLEGDISQLQPENAPQEELAQPKGLPEIPRAEETFKPKGLPETPSAEETFKPKGLPEILSAEGALLRRCQVMFAGLKEKYPTSAGMLIPSTLKPPSLLGVLSDIRYTSMQPDWDLSKLEFYFTEKEPLTNNTVTHLVDLFDVSYPEFSYFGYRIGMQNPLPNRETDKDRRNPTDISITLDMSRTFSARLEQNRLPTLNHQLVSPEMLYTIATNIIEAAEIYLGLPAAKS